MNVNRSIYRVVGLGALASFGGVVSAQAQATVPAKPHADVAPIAATAAPAADAEQAPIDKFDLAAALMAPSGGLTADDAGKKARARAPQIFAAKATATGAQTDVDGSWASFIPTIDVTGQIKYISNVANSVGGGAGLMIPGFDPKSFTQPRDQYSLTASANYVLSDIFLKAWPAYKAAVGMAESQKTQIEVASSMVDLTARNAFYEYARSLAQRAVDEQSLKQAEAQAAQIKLFVDAGTSAQVDHMTAVARVEETRSALAGSNGRVAIAQNTLATLMGIKVEEVHGVSEPVLELPEQPKGSSEELLHRAYESRAELRALRKLVAANERLEGVQLGSALPALSVFANDLYAQPNPRYIPPNRNEFKNSWEIGAALSWRPNNSISGTYGKRKAAAQTAKARADLGAQEDSVRIEVFTAYENYKSAAAVTAASQARLAAAEEAYRVRLATYRVGAGVIVDLLNADLTVSQARLALANAAINTRAALAALNRAAGLDQ